MASILDKVDVHDAGDRLILSSQDEATLKYVIEEMRKEGAQAIQAPVKEANNGDSSSCPRSGRIVQA